MAEDTIVTRIEASVAGFVGPLSTATEAVEAFLGPLAAIGAAFAAFHEITSAVDETVELAKSLQVLSEKTGIATEELSAMEYAAKQSEVSTQSLTVGLQRLARGMEEAAKGGKGPAVEALKDLGVEATTADGKMRPFRDVLLDIATRFHYSEDGSRKAALALDIFGRSGTDLIPLLNRGADGIAELEKEARDLGVTMTDKDVQAALVFEEGLKRLHAVWDAFKRTLVVDGFPALEKLVDLLTAMVHATAAAMYAWGALSHAMSGSLASAKADLLLMVDELKKIPGDFATRTPAQAAGAGNDIGLTPHGGPTALQLLREEWNKRKQIAIDGNEDLLAVEIAFWREKLATAKEGSTDYIEIHTKLVDLEEQFAKRTTREWADTFKAVPQIFNDALRSMQNTAGGFREFMRGVWYDLVAMSAQAGFEMLATFAAQELTKRKITEKSALETIAIKTWEGIRWIAIEAAKAAAAAYSAIAGIPFIGPALAVGAAAVAFAGVMSLASHLSGGGGRGGGGGSFNVGTAATRGGGNTNITIQAMDSKSFKDFASDHSDTFVHVIAKAAKDGSLTPKKLGLA